jgi:hypothetical protein
MKFAIFVPAFASINPKVAKLTASVAKNSSVMKQKKNTDLTGDIAGDLTEDLIGDIVAKKFCYCSKIYLAGAKKKVLSWQSQTLSKTL